MIELNYSDDYSVKLEFEGNSTIDDNTHHSSFIRVENSKIRLVVDGRIIPPNTSVIEEVTYSNGNYLLRCVAVPNSPGIDGYLNKNKWGEEILRFERDSTEMSLKEFLGL